MKINYRYTHYNDAATLIIRKNTKANTEKVSSAMFSFRLCVCVRARARRCI